jgi:hypothetical protein
MSNKQMDYNDEDAEAADCDANGCPCPAHPGYCAYWIASASAGWVYYAKYCDEEGPNYTQSYSDWSNSLDDGEIETRWQAKVDAKEADPKGVRIPASERDRWLVWRCPGFDRWAPKNDARPYGDRTVFDDPPVVYAAVDAEPAGRMTATAR